MIWSLEFPVIVGHSAFACLVALVVFWMLLYGVRARRGWDGVLRYVEKASRLRYVLSRDGMRDYSSL